MKSARLEEFRQVAYKYLGRAKDATFELTDAILLTRNVYSLADLSLSPVFRRKWPSIYEALQDSRPQRQKLMRPMSLIKVERLDEQGNQLVSKPLWLAWVGEEMPPLEEVWRLYLRRFTVDHWYRFLKQRLHWTVPNFGTPEQSERWSDLMPLMTWELWLARDIVTDNPLPWQKSQSNLTPGRVAQAMGGVFAVIGTPTRAPKPRGKSPGWQPGKKRLRKNRCPIVKKIVTRPRKKPSVAV